MIKVIYFDVGGVIVTDGFWRCKKQFAKMLGKSEADVWKAYLATDFPAYSAGTISPKQRWNAFFHKLKIKKYDFNKAMKIWHSVFKPIKGTMAVAKRMKSKGYKIGILSDQAMDTLKTIKKRVNLSIFSPRIISSEVKLSKQDGRLRMYKLAVKRAGVKPSQILFIDNNKEHLADARKFGMKTLLFKSSKQIKKVLSEMI